MASTDATDRARFLRQTSAASADIDRAMQDTLTTRLTWLASGGGMIAALVVSFESGRRVTGWGFVIFVGSSIASVVGALLTKYGALGTQNAMPVATNMFGVYRHLIRQKPSG